MNKYLAPIFIVALFKSAIGCYAQIPYDEFCESIRQCDLSATEFIIDGSVHAYYKQYYKIPDNYDDLICFAPSDDREYLVTLCDSLFYKNRQLITFIPNPDSSALLYSGKIVFGLYSQYSCKDMLTSPVSLGVHMVDTLGHSFYDDSVANVIMRHVLPAVYKKASQTDCEKYYMSYNHNKIVCSIPYLYYVGDKTLVPAESCKRCNIEMCNELVYILEAELRKCVFNGVKLISFPLHLYLGKEHNDIFDCLEETEKCHTKTKTN